MIDRYPELAAQIRDLRSRLSDVEQNLPHRAHRFEAVKNAGFLEPAVTSLAAGVAVLQSNGPVVPIVFDAELDTVGGRDPLLPEQITIRRAGVYAVSASASVRANPTGWRMLELRLVSGGTTRTLSTTASAAPPSSTVHWGASPSLVLPLKVGDVLTLRASQANDAGVSLTVLGGRLAATWLGVTPSA